MIAAFTEKMLSQPTSWVRAPGRVELMGSHTDYNDGFVLTAAIDRDTWIAAAPRPDRLVRVISLNQGTTRSFAIEDVPQQGDWVSYVHGVLWGMLMESYSFPGFNAVIHGTVPLGGGLSSSASLSVATAVLAARLGKCRIESLELARLCQQSENDTVGVPCGILDPFSSLFGKGDHAMLLDCRRRTCDNIQIPSSIRIVVCDTRAPRRLANSAYGDRRTECETGVRLLSDRLPGIGALRDVSMKQFTEHVAELPTVVANRCRYILEENQRVLDLAKALTANDHASIKTLCDASFEGADEQYEIVVDEMRAMRDAAKSSPGIIGVRNSGGGFGGCLVAFVKKEEVVEFTASTARTYQASTGITPKVFVVNAADGAGDIPM